MFYDLDEKAKLQLLQRTEQTVHMRRLREKIEADPGNPEYIHTMWGVGYRFKEPDE